MNIDSSTWMLRRIHRLMETALETEPSVFSMVQREFHQSQMFAAVNPRTAHSTQPGHQLDFLNKLNELKILCLL
jgi:hypothetical protein